MGHKSGCPVYSMPGRRPDHRPTTGKDAPDAGIYDPNSKYSSLRPVAPNFSVGKSRRDGGLNLNTDPLGATAYNPNDS